METSNISATAERAVHDGLREFAEKLWTQHGICLKAARFDWLDLSTVGSAHMQLTDVEADTTTKAGR